MQYMSAAKEHVIVDINSFPAFFRLSTWSLLDRICLAIMVLYFLWLFVSFLSDVSSIASSLREIARKMK